MSSASWDDGDRNYSSTTAEYGKYLSNGRHSFPSRGFQFQALGTSISKEFRILYRETSVCVLFIQTLIKVGVLLVSTKSGLWTGLQSVLESVVVSLNVPYLEVFFDHTLDSLDS